MHHLIWFLILAPPVLAYVLWMGVGQGGATAVRFGRYGYWIILAICYASFFGVALALHKI